MLTNDIVYSFYGWNHRTNFLRNFWSSLCMNISAFYNSSLKEKCGFLMLYTNKCIFVFLKLTDGLFKKGTSGCGTKIYKLHQQPWYDLKDLTGLLDFRSFGLQPYVTPIFRPYPTRPHYNGQITTY